MDFPVTDAKATINVPSAGKYKVFVRTFNWTWPWYKDEGHGEFKLLTNGKSVGNMLINTITRMHKIIT